MGKNGKGTKSRPVIMVGLDSADPDLILKWSSEGHLPAIASLINRGSWGKLSSTAIISSGSLWPTFFTGTSPAKHGCFFGHRQLKSGTYQLHKIYADEIKRKPFWQWLSREGIRVSVFDVPYTYPLEGLNGMQIVAWGADAPHWHMSSRPSRLIKQIVSRFGTHPLADWYQMIPKSIGDCEVLYRNLISGIEKKGLISEYLLGQERLDLFLVAFSEPHWAGHLLWHTIDETHSAHNPEIAKIFGSAIRDVYAGIDSVISKLIKAVPDATFIVFSPAGMEPNCSGVHLLPEVLERMGMTGKTVPDGNRRGRFSAAFKGMNLLIPHKRWGPYTLKKLESFIPTRVIETIKRAVPEKLWDNWTRRLLTAGNDWRWGKAFCVPNDFSGAIRVNLKGREPHGLVEQGGQYNALCDELVEELGSLVNPETGKNAVSEVLRVDELCQGENIWDLPDLLVIWAKDGPVRALYSPRLGTVTGENPDKRMGAHKSEGILIASGEEISPGRAVKEGHIMDIAPTLLYMMGFRIPRDMDGKVLLDIINEDFKAGTPVRYL